MISNSTVEVFELGDIRLRKPRIEDAEAIFEYASDPAVAHFADWPIRDTIGQIVDSLHERIEKWGNGSEFYWIIAETENDTAIGSFSCTIHGSAAEIGYVVNKKYWGKGYATKAAKAVLHWLKSNPALKRVFATCDTENVASARVLEKIGMQRECILKNYCIRPNISDEPRDAYRYSIK